MSLCNDPEGWQLLTNYYDVSPCVSQNVFFILPGSVAALFGVPAVVHLYFQPGKRPAVWSYTLKQILTLIQLSIAVSIPFTTTFQHDLRHWSPLVLAFGSIIIFFIQKLEFEKRKPSSTVALSFWGLQTLDSAIVVYGLGIRGFDEATYVVSLISIAFLGLFNLVLETTYSPSSEPAFYDDSNLFVKLTYSYVSPILSKGINSTLKIGNVPKPPLELRSQYIFREFSEVWGPKIDLYTKAAAKDPETAKFPSLIATFSYIHGYDYLKISLLQVFSIVVPFVQPLLLKQLILFVAKYNNGLAPLSQGISIVFAAGSMMLLRTIIESKEELMTNNLMLRIETALSQTVYEKALRLSTAAVADTSIGEIVNILSNSVKQLTSVVSYLHMIWSIPLQITICWLTMYSMIGNAMWVGMAALLLVVPFTAFISKLKMGLFLAMQGICESRYTVTNNLLSNIKSVKLYGWEPTFYGKVEKIRNEEELAIVRKMSYLSAIESILMRTCNNLAATASFAFIVLFQHIPLSAASAIPALNLFTRLLMPFMFVPYIVQFGIQAWVALTKINNFLGLTEVEKFNGQEHIPDSSKSVPVNVNGSFFWDKQLEKAALENISYTADKGATVCIIGKVGAGKTATLMATLNELFVQNGSTSVTGSVAYSSQVPWILNSTVKDNILFGSREDPIFYNLVIEACALTHDLQLLADGDQTEVGEKGISLSGGQKARLSIARAVYSRADVQLYDDPLSAVDEHVQAHLIKNVFGPGGLLSSKTVVVATNTVNLLRHSSTIHLIEDKTFVESGEFSELMTRDGKIKKLVDEFQTQAGESTPDASKVIDAIEVDDKRIESDAKHPFSLRRASSISHFSVITVADDDARRTRVEDEVKETEALNFVELYKKYFVAVGYINMGVYLVLSLVGSALTIASTYWVAEWGSDKIDLSDIQLVLGYFFIRFASALFEAFGGLAFSTFGAVRASKLLHERMLKAVLRAPMSFFEATPLGRLTTRFSQDIAKLDWMMNNFITRLATAVITSFSSLVLIVGSSPSTLVVVPPALYLYRIIQKYYLITSRQVRRLSAATMSPVVSHFQETLNGLTTVRAFGKSRFFSTKSTAHIDVRTKMEFLSYSLQQWLGLRLTTIGVVIFLSSGLSLVATLHWKPLSAGLVGLVMSYASTISSCLSEVVKAAISVEQESVVLERIFEFCQIEPEAPPKAKEPAAHWPNEGRITFSNYSTKYRANLDPVLNELSFNIKPREKVGVVGRTGAGKSSLTMALFRIIEASGGSITIDGEEISNIGLQDLRSRLSIIPQDAQMFEGTIKTNLDPSGKFSDTELLQVLEHASLKKFADDNEGLETKLSDGGSNLSLGQKQLICLGRALLTPSSILVLDEATAAVDYETDKLIQKTIRREFKDRTILTIAHRLNTVMDSDRILVLDAGNVVEFDTPEELLKNKNSLFYALVNANNGDKLDT
ncbi:YALI0E08969p [Yarrowia lipolytica CLIB122]|uniref:YALI0E08969p n=1 Tax=Yarrowia lipolytica (strain CLIB 122 / E 150) TaxID=284591 RepID=Q6C6J9_YARLI|nr:YALI0E08969p [Yarrowia lipolytica CLIB122]CAG79302.1 YALI0E08969p [Yarrowia lipolytica CLIB122]|eukprot:XP_503713.1 YALI0E08969p [Yarrowia lipolytica CLIB122]